MKKKVVLRLQGETQHLDKIRSFVLEYAKDIGFDEEALSEIEMAVDEAATNSIKYSYKMDPDIPQELRFLQVELKQIRKGIEIVIKDNGKFFNLRNYPDVKLENHLSQFKSHGLGIFAIRRFMDEVKHQYRKGAGNIIIMKKFISKRSR